MVKYKQNKFSIYSSEMQRPGRYISWKKWPEYYCLQNASITVLSSVSFIVIINLWLFCDTDNCTLNFALKNEMTFKMWWRMSVREAAFPEEDAYISDWDCPGVSFPGSSCAATRPLLPSAFSALDRVPPASRLSSAGVCVWASDVQPSSRSYS